MGCDIHITLEIRLKREGYLIKDDTCTWEVYPRYSKLFNGSRNYKMFAKLADVRNYDNVEHIPIRGVPEDISDEAFLNFCLRVRDVDEKYVNDDECTPDNANSWISYGNSMEINKYSTRYVTHPDYHSYNWCTTQEMEECFNEIFPTQTEYDAVEWAGLLGMMKGVEASGKYECRAIFAFDS